MSIPYISTSNRVSIGVDPGHPGQVSLKAKSMKVQGTRPFSLLNLFRLPAKPKQIDIEIKADLKNGPFLNVSRKDIGRQIRACLRENGAQMWGRRVTSLAKQFRATLENQFNLSSVNVELCFPDAGSGTTTAQTAFTLRVGGKVRSADGKQRDRGVLDLSMKKLREIVKDQAGKAGHKLSSKQVKAAAEQLSSALKAQVAKAWMEKSAPLAPRAVLPAQEEVPQAEVVFSLEPTPSAQHAVPVAQEAWPDVPREAPRR